MLYIIQCLLKGEIVDYHKNLVNEIADNFNLTLTKEENLSAHFTIKYWFDTKNVEEVERIIAKFCSSHKKTKLTAEGFSGFDSNVIFIDLKLSKEANEIFIKLIDELKTIPWMPWDKYDGKMMHFHCTIAEECEKKYKEVMNYLKGKEKFIPCLFDNITILKLVSGMAEKGQWIVHKEFLFQ